MIEKLLLYWPQIGITICGVSAVWLAMDERPKVKRWAPVLGLLAQPFWALETISKGQYFITGLCLLYGAGWLRGFNSQWVKPWRDGKRPKLAAPEPLTSTEVLLFAKIYENQNRQTSDGVIHMGCRRSGQRRIGPRERRAGGAASELIMDMLRHGKDRRRVESHRIGGKPTLFLHSRRKHFGYTERRKS